MIPIAAAAEFIPLILGAVRLIRGLLPDEEQKLLVQWADLLKEGPKDSKEESSQWRSEIRQFLSNLTLRRGYSPAYQYEQEISIPEDMLTDLVDLLIGGWTSGGKWSPGNLLRNPEKDRQGWAATIATGRTHLILAESTEWLAKRGRTRAYSPFPAIRVDQDWFADAVGYLIG